MTTPHLNPDGPHDPDRTEYAAKLIRDTTRFLVYASMPQRAARGLRYPGHLYTVLWQLSSTAALYDQMLRQFAEFLTDEADAGRLRRDDGGDVSDRITAAMTQLDRARRAAAELERALANAQSAINDVASAPKP